MGSCAFSAAHRQRRTLLLLYRYSKHQIFQFKPCSLTVLCNENRVTELHALPILTMACFYNISSVSI